jgi:hypothetical protein
MAMAQAQAQRGMADHGRDPVRACAPKAVEARTTSPQPDSTRSGVPRFLRARAARPASGDGAAAPTDRAHPTRRSSSASGPRAAPGVPMAFPHGSAISASLAASIPQTARFDPASCAVRGVPAFTNGAVAHFATPSPSLHVAAHEAAHLLQHTGRTRDAGLVAERHAHAVADRVSRGASARALIGTWGRPVSPALRDYMIFTSSEQAAAGQWQVGGNAYVGDEGRTVTTSADKHLCYADPALIIEANAILKAKKSGINMEPGSAGPSGDAPDGSGFKSTVKVNYNILSDESNEKFFADCGVSAREVMGESETDTAAVGVYTDAAGNRRETARSKNPADFRDEIFLRSGLGSTRASAHAAYNSLTDAEKDDFDRRHSINKYALPGVGEAFTRRRDDMLGGTGFNFHWGGVIMVAGGDRVTFENYTKGRGYKAKDKDWYFATYGPPSKPGQTWHERWQSVGGAGKGTTLAAATSADPGPFIKGAAAMRTSELIARYQASADPGERMALESEMRSRWIQVTVFVKKAQEGRDEVYVTAEHGGRRYKTGDIKLGSGQKNTFWIPLDSLAPVTGKIVVKVYDWDLLSRDDLMSHIGFDAPYALQSDTRPWDEAEYHTTVEFHR